MRGGEVKKNRREVEGILTGGRFGLFFPNARLTGIPYSIDDGRTNAPHSSKAWLDFICAVSASVGTGFIVGGGFPGKHGQQRG
jgi:hypothetical protein